MKLIWTAILMGIFRLPLFAADPKEVTFWRWFQSNEDRLYFYDRDRARTFSDLSGALRKVDKNLTFEFGPIQQSGRREFVVSAGGIQGAFPAVKSVIAAAPKLDRWTFVAFRQRRASLIDLVFEGKKVKAQDVSYLLFRDEDPKKVGIILFFDGYNDSERNAFGNIGFLYLDQTLGEYDVEMKIGKVLFQGRDSAHFANSKPLTELSSAVDAYFAGH